jgi:hypothetical protein
MAIATTPDFRRRESGLQHLDEYLNVKAVWIKTA